MRCKLLLSVLLCCLFAPISFAQTLSALTHKMSHSAGFVDVYADTQNARVLIAVHELDSPFLFSTALPAGLGSNDVGLDRGQVGRMRTVEFRRIGKKIFLVEINSRFIANSDDARERLAVQEAFAESVLWSAPILNDDSAGLKKYLLDLTSFVQADRHGIAQRLQRSEQGKYSIDAERTSVLPEASKSFPNNAEFESLLTFSGDGEGQFVRDVAMDSRSISVRQRISFVRLPDTNFNPRAFHPASGGFSDGVFDFATPLSNSLEKRFQARFRLEKIDPSAARSKVKKPIVFYLDGGTPEPIRSALLEGANWWKAAFDKAGFIDAYRVEILPADIDPMDVRYNVIMWTHRATRGWSYGNALTDPRTGEIIRGVVNLGSQRVRQDILIAEGLLAPYGKKPDANKQQAAQGLALARLRQLAAHEVGHTLGFAHNFAASRQGNGSVMDYPHPNLRIDAKGEIDLSQAYGVGIGPWDEYIVQHAYAQFPSADESTELAKLRQNIAKRGFLYISDSDVRNSGASHADGLLWDYGVDTLQTFDEILRIRRKALDNFSLAVLPPDRQVGELEARLVPIYLLHRYQTEAVARLLAGTHYQYSIASDDTAGSKVVDAKTQKAALDRLLATLQTQHLALPKSLTDLLTPPASEYSRTREYFATRTAPNFDLIAATQASVAITTQFLFDPARINRMYLQQADNPELASVADLMIQVFAATWKNRDQRFSVAQLAANWVVTDAVLNLLASDQLHPQVSAQLRIQLRLWQSWLANEANRSGRDEGQTDAAQLIGGFLSDPNSVKLRSAPAIPPGAPI